MGIKRIVDTSFWTDNKVDDFSPEDKYFMLYLLSNPFTTQLGIYELSIKQAAFQMGYSVDAVNVLLDRFENQYCLIKWAKDTNEVAIKNFLRHSIMKGGAPVRDCLVKELKQVKNKDLIDWVFSSIKDSVNLNATVKNIISEYESKHGILHYCAENKKMCHDSHNDSHNDLHNDSCNDMYHNDNENDNENDNDNEKTYQASLTPEKPKPSKADIDSFFNSIWNLYPVKKGKGQVSDAKRKVLFKVGFDEMKRAIQRYLQELSKDASWRKPQNGSTFFNSGYVDYLDENFVPSEDVTSTNKPVDSTTNQQLRAIQERQQKELEEINLEELEKGVF